MRLKSGAHRTTFAGHFARRSGDVIHLLLWEAGSGYETITLVGLKRSWDDNVIMQNEIYAFKGFVAHFNLNVLF